MARESDCMIANNKFGRGELLPLKAQARFRLFFSFCLSDFRFFRCQIKWAHLLTPHYRHWRALERTLSARPMGRASALPFDSKCQFCSGQQPKPQICFSVFQFIVPTDRFVSTLVGLLRQVLFTPFLPSPPQMP